jgi:mRNA interferase MazF
VKRGEVWWADLPSPTGRRPVVLLSRDEAYAVRALVTVAPVTTRIRHIPAEVPLGPEDSLPRVCVANLDTILTIAKASLREYLTSLSSEKLRAMDAAIHFALGLED